MRTVSVFSLVIALCLVAPWGGLRAADPTAWPGFPALENGDVNSDGALDLSDAVLLLGWLYRGGPELAPLACATGYSALTNGDSNGDENLDVSDPISLLGYLFGGGAAPVNACALGLEGDGEGGHRRHRPRILPPHAHAFGKTLGEWSAAWWQWAIPIPIDAHPLFDTAGCDVGQSGKVWFLGGAFTGAVTTRECTVPHGKAILFPVVNVECSTAEPPPFFGSNEAELRACAKAFQDTAAGLSATIDGHDVRHLDRYRVQSPVFDFTAPENNLLFIPGPVSGQSVSDGVWILLAPPSRGEHVIHFKAAFPEFQFEIDVTYNITVD